MDQYLPVLQHDSMDLAVWIDVMSILAVAICGGYFMSMFWEVNDDTTEE